MFAVLALLLAPTALADPAACTACCRAGGLQDCATEVRVVGNRSRVQRGASGWEVTGLWILGCGGASRFLAGAGATLDHAPVPGELVGDDVNPLTVHCFAEACAIPKNACIVPSGLKGVPQIVDCATRQALSEDDWAVQGRGAPAGASIVVVDGKPLVVASDVATSGAPTEPAGPVTAALPAYPSEADRDPLTAAVSAPAPVVVAPPPPPPPPPPPKKWEPTLPTDPPVECRNPIDEIAQEAQKRVAAGDDRRIRNDHEGAFKEYRAALTMDVCNAYAWLGLGQASIGLGRPDLAIHAYGNTTRILPAHYGAWTLLGHAYETIRQRALAHDAYQTALRMSPGYGEAVEGERRTR